MYLVASKRGNMQLTQKIDEAIKYITAATLQQPTIGLILGSGLGDLADQIENATTHPYDSIPHFPVSTVKGHAGQLVIGQLSGKTVVAMQGRLHYYEGYSMEQITFPVRVMRALGVETLLLTNAVGALNPDYYVGGLMAITDHINFMHGNPLIGPNDETLGPRFPDMLHLYNPLLREKAQAVAKQQDIELFEGVLSAVSGPTFETQAEAKMLRYLGADVVGMSVVPEAIVARHSGLDILGISAITDMAADEAGVSHAEVIEAANKIKPKFTKLIKAIIEII